jgi:hypothetical protein
MPSATPGQNVHAETSFFMNEFGALQTYAPQYDGYQSIVKWTAPTGGGTFSLSGTLQMQQSCGYGNDYFIYFGTTLLSSGHLTSAATSIAYQSISMGGGDSLYIIMNPKEAYYCQEVILNIQVNKQ